jgi:hypothetical protein
MKNRLMIKRKKIMYKMLSIFDERKFVVVLLRFGVKAPQQQKNLPIFQITVKNIYDPFNHVQ